MGLGRFLKNGIFVLFFLVKIFLFFKFFLVNLSFNFKKIKDVCVEKLM